MKSHISTVAQQNTSVGRVIDRLVKLGHINGPLSFGPYREVDDLHKHGDVSVFHRVKGNEEVTLSNMLKMFNIKGVNHCMTSWKTSLYRQRLTLNEQTAIYRRLLNVAPTIKGMEWKVTQNANHNGGKDLLQIEAGYYMDGSLTNDSDKEDALFEAFQVLVKLNYMFR